MLVVIVRVMLMLISQKHVYDRVWARGHASTG
jgi:hypothetical protein